MKRKLFRGEFLLCFLFLIISVVSVFFTMYMMKSYNIEILSQGFYSKNAKHITLKSNQNIFSEIKDGTLYIESTNINFDVRYIYTNGTTYTPLIIEGRYFEDVDFTNNDHIAVIGKNLKSFCLHKNGNEYYIEHDGIEYKVVGIIGNDIASKIDNTCFLSMCKDISFSEEVLIVDSNNKKSVENIIGKITKKVGEQNIQLLNVPIKGVSNWLNTEINSMIFYMTILVLFALNSIVLTSYWVQNRMQHIAVMRLCGFGDFRVISFISIRYFKCLLGGFFSGFIITVPYLLFAENFSLWLLCKTIIITFCIMLVFGILVSIFPSYYACKMDVIPLLRRAERNEG